LERMRELRKKGNIINAEPGGKKVHQVGTGELHGSNGREVNPITQRRETMRRFIRGGVKVTCRYGTLKESVSKDAFKVHLR